MTEDIKQLESLGYKPEIPNKPKNNALVIINQLEGCIKIIKQLLDELRKAIE